MLLAWAYGMCPHGACQGIGHRKKYVSLLPGIVLAVNAFVCAKGEPRGPVVFFRCFFPPSAASVPMGPLHRPICLDLKSWNGSVYTGFAKEKALG